MDTIILAAGRNERLKGVVAPGYKPLLIFNGKSLLRHAVDSAAGGRVIVVASPENAQAISHVVPNYVNITIQRTPSGPGHALMAGLDWVTSDEILLLLGDNLTPLDDVKRVADANGNAVGIGMIAPELAQRYTRIRTDSLWVEKTPIEKLDIHPNGKCHIWLGPVKLVKSQIETVLRPQAFAKFDPDVEIPIGPFFNDLRDVTCVDVHSIDVGVPEELT